MARSQGSPGVNTTRGAPPWLGTHPESRQRNPSGSRILFAPFSPCHPQGPLPPSVAGSPCLVPRWKTSSLTYSSPFQPLQTSGYCVAHLRLIGRLLDEGFSTRSTAPCFPQPPEPLHLLCMETALPGPPHLLAVYTGLF